MSTKSNDQEELNNQKDHPDLLARAAKIKVLLMDVDGVLTDGKLFYFPDSENKMVEFKGFNSHDGLGLFLCNFAGIITGVISGRTSPATIERARILKMRYVYQGNLEKVAAWEEILKDAQVEAFHVVYIGDDLPDMPLMHRAGLAIAVANARPEVKAIAHYVTEHSGGDGGVRDATELILKASGNWENAAGRYQLAGSST